jgi:membrane associated rhomboid family serine protease
MFPYHDENQTLRPALVTLLFIGLNVVTWFLVQGAGMPLDVARSVCNYGLIPGELTGSVSPGTRFPIGDGLACVIDPGPQVSHVVTSMFLHGSWMHLIGNMWFLWLFGNNVEDAMGPARFAVFYLVCGVAAALAQVVTNPASPIPMVGASGAISGVMGGYLVLYPHVRVYCLMLPFFATLAMPAWTMLLYWFALQFIGGLAGLAAKEGGGVAFWAHAGGFVAGLILIKLFARRDYLDAHRAAHWRPRSVRF